MRWRSTWDFKCIIKWLCNSIFDKKKIIHVERIIYDQLFSIIVLELSRKHIHVR